MNFSFWIFVGRGNDQDCLFEGLRQSSSVQGDIMYCKEWQKHTWLFVIWVVRTTPTLPANISAESGHFDIFPAYFWGWRNYLKHHTDQECGIIIIGTLWRFIQTWQKCNNAIVVCFLWEALNRDVMINVQTMQGLKWEMTFWCCHQASM